MRNHEQRGFGVVEIILIVVIIGVLGFIAWRVYDSGMLGGENEPKNSQQKEPAEQTKTEEPPEVNNEEDLQKAEQYLKDTDVEGETNTSEMDAALQ